MPKFEKQYLQVYILSLTFMRKVFCLKHECEAKDAQSTVIQI